MKKGSEVKFRLKQNPPREGRGVITRVYKSPLRFLVKVDWNFPDKIITVYKDEIIRNVTVQNRTQKRP